MEYIAYKSMPNSGLCHMLMGITRTIEECIYRSKQGKEVTLLLEDLQSRTNTDTVDFEVNFMPIPYDAIINVDKLTAFLNQHHVAVQRASEVDYDNINVIYCERYLVRLLSEQEYRYTGYIAANLLPYNDKLLNISRLLIEEMAKHSPDNLSWGAFHLRIEEELINKFYFGNTNDVHAYRKEQLSYLNEFMAQFSPNPVIYIAHGLREENYAKVKDELMVQFPKAYIATKKDLLSGHKEVFDYINSISLEEQAFLDWLVCMQAPNFAGIHYSSFAYFAVYVRHYQGVDQSKSVLFPPIQEYWDRAFARV